MEGRVPAVVDLEPVRRLDVVCWHRQIAAWSRPDRVFDKMGEVIAETGSYRGRRKRCLDSTVFDDAVAIQDTVTQLVAAMRKVARAVPGRPRCAALLRLAALARLSLFMPIQSVFRAYPGRD